MKNDTKHHHLAFLLSFGALPILGCPAADDEETDTNNSTQTQTDPSTTNPSTTDPTGDTDPSTTNSTTASTTNSTDPTGDTDPSTTDPTGDTDPSTTDPDTGTTGDVPDVCETYGAHYVKCFPKYGDADKNAAYCAYVISTAETYGAECVTAWEEVYACLNALDCGTWQKATEKNPVCAEQTDAAVAACGGDTSGSGGAAEG